MDAKIKSEWVAELRSGKYRQAVGHLRSPEGYCALGVLCELLGDDLIDGALYPANALLSGVGILPYSDFVHTVIKMNEDGRTFPEIADYVEAAA